MSGWRYFKSRQVAEARIWAAEGGVAVHENIWKSRDGRTCHLLARDEEGLVAAAVQLGCPAWWIQRTRTLHFDLVEVYLERALGRCETSAARLGAPVTPAESSPPAAEFR